MTIPFSNLCFIQNHNYGGQVLLILDSNELKASTMDKSQVLKYVYQTAYAIRKISFEKDLQHSAVAILSLVPMAGTGTAVANNDTSALYYLAVCSVKPTTPAPIEPLPPIMPEILRAYIVPQGEVAPPMTADVQRIQNEYTTQLNQFQSSFSFYDQARSSWINTSPCECRIDSIVSRTGGKFSLIPFAEGVNYDTCWSVINLPKINQTADAQLLRMHKSGDPNDRQFLQLTTPFPNIVPTIIELSLSKSITNDWQLWCICKP